MLKSRLIFTLLFEDGFYNLSRNFRLQRVGGLDWVQENYDFDSIARSIDELVVLDVSRSGKSDIDALAFQVRCLSERCFMPIAAGGGIRAVADAQRLFQAGADKVVLNSAYFKYPELIRELASIYGVQSIIASIDYRRDESDFRRVYCQGGTEDTGMNLEQAVRLVQDIGAGELYLTSMNNDGTGNGYDFGGLMIGAENSLAPIIASGGAGNHVHFTEAIRSGYVNAVSTANLFNFMCDGLRETRELMAANGVPLCVWKKEI